MHFVDQFECHLLGNALWIGCLVYWLSGVCTGYSITGCLMASFPNDLTYTRYTSGGSKRECARGKEEDERGGKTGGAILCLVEHKQTQVRPQPHTSHTQVTPQPHRESRACFQQQQQRLGKRIDIQRRRLLPLVPALHYRRLQCCYTRVCLCCSWYQCVQRWSKLEWRRHQCQSCSRASKHHGRCATFGGDASSCCGSCLRVYLRLCRPPDSLLLLGTALWCATKRLFESSRTRHQDATTSTAWLVHAAAAQEDQREGR